MTIKSGGSGERFSEESLELKKYEDGNSRRDIDIFMDGFEVFRFVSQAVSKYLEGFIKDSVGEAEKIEAFIPHQANMYMIKQLAKKLKISWENTWKSGEDVGNSGSATVPITIAYNANELLTKDKTMTLVTGFGGGLSASAGIISLSARSAIASSTSILSVALHTLGRRSFPLRISVFAISIFAVL